MSKVLSCVFPILAFAFALQAQTKPAVKPAVDLNIRSTPAYAELLLRKTEPEAEVESLLTEYTDDYPKVRDLKLELEILRPEVARVLAVKSADAGKLSQALGKMILTKVAHATALRKLQMQFQDAHPHVKKAKRMVEIYEAAIKEVLG